MFFDYIKNNVVKEKKILIQNVISLSALQLVTYVIPLLTTPYLVRVLGADGFGKVAYSAAVIACLALVSEYGFNLSATRAISIHRDDFRKVNEIYSNVFTIKILLLFTSSMLLFFFILYMDFSSKDKLLYFFTFGQVIGQALLPLWLYQGLERMRFITYVNVFAKIFFLISLFFIVKEHDDYYIVPLLTSLGSIMGGGAALWYAKYKVGIRFTRPSIHSMKGYFCGGFSFFGIAASSTILASSSLLFLGFYMNQEAVGYYSAIERIVKAIQSLFSPVSQSFFPYVSRLMASSKDKAVREIKKLMLGVCIVTLLLLVVLNIFSDEITVLFYGPLYKEYSRIFLLLSPWFLLGVLNNILGCQFLTAIGMGKVYLKMFIISSVATIVFFTTLIPEYGVNGVAYAMSLGEFVLFVLLLLSSKYFAGNCRVV